MSDPTYQGDVTAGGDWSKVHTGLDWVAQWMSDRGYTDAEIAYVIDRPATPFGSAEVVPSVVDAPAAAEVESTAPVWTVRLGTEGPEAGSEEHGPVVGDENVDETAQTGEDAPVDPEDGADAEPSEQVPA